MIDPNTPAVRRLSAFLLLALAAQGCTARKPAAPAEPATATAEPPKSSGGAAPAQAAPEVPAGPAVPIASLPCPKLGAPAPPSPPSQDVRLGIAAYDAGKYLESTLALEKADKAGALDGPALYRLGFGYDTVRQDHAAAIAVYERARAAIEDRVAKGAATLEERFYLVNTLKNLKQTDAARAASNATLDAIKTCKLYVPPDGDAAFRVADLMRESADADGRLLWLRRSVDEFSKTPANTSPYAKRAAADLAPLDLAAGRWSTALLALERLSADSPTDPNLRFQVIVARVGTGDFDGALRDVERVRPIAGERVDDLAYIEGMIRKARRMRLAGHPFRWEQADGKLPSDLSGDDLGLQMRDSAEKGRLLVNNPPSEGDTVVVERGKQKTKVRLPSPGILAKIDEEQGRLLALTLEAVRRGAPIQEAAFTAGIAPLVLRDWREIWVQNRRDEDVAAAEKAAASSGAPPATPAP